MNKTHLYLIIILLLASFLRFGKLGDVPGGYTNDEANYIVSAYSIWQTHRDLSGVYLPLSFNLFNSYSPVEIYLISPFVGLLGLSPLTARLPFAIVGTVFVLLIFLLTKELLKSDAIALVASFIMAISPWHLQLSKIAQGCSLSLFFYTLAFYLFLRYVKDGRFLWSLPFFLLGFYSSHATKVFFVFFIPFLLFFFRDELLKKKKEATLFLGGIIFILLSFSFVSSTQIVTRQDVFLWNDTESLTRIVDRERFINSAPNLLRNLFSNKLLTIGRTIRENYLYAFSMDYLFLYGEKGDNEKVYGTSGRGIMYIVELPLLILGIIFLLRQKGRTKTLIFASLLLAPLPSAFTIDRSYGMRSLMMIPFLAIITGVGLVEFWQWLGKKKKALKYSLAFLFVVFYLFLVLEYLYQFYFRYPLYGAEPWNRSKRDLVEYLGSVKGNYKNVYIANKGELLIQYVLFNKTDAKIAQAAYQSNLPKKIDNVSFIGSCFETKKEPFDPNIYLPKDTLYAAPFECHETAAVLPIKTIIEAGEPLHTVWSIFERKE